jgi:HTH domain found in ParB protein
MARLARATGGQIAALKLITGRDLNVREAERLAEIAQDKAAALVTRQALLAGQITNGQAQALLRIEDQALQERVLEVVLTYGLGARDTEVLTERVAEGVPLESAVARFQRSSVAAQPALSAAQAQLGSPNLPSPPQTREPAAEDGEIQRMFEEALATPVQLTRSGNTIKLLITFYSEEQLQSLYDLIANNT